MNRFELKSKKVNHSDSNEIVKQFFSLAYKEASI
jgi:hypothetical protein